MRSHASKVLFGLLISLGAAPANATSLYVSSIFSNEVLRFDATTGKSLGVFASGGGLNVPRGLAFGLDGHLYVSSGESDAILRYSGKNGSFIGTFASHGPLDGPTGLIFGPDGNLYVSSTYNDKILRYNGSTGEYIDTFVATNLETPKAWYLGLTRIYISLTLAPLM